MHTHPQGLLHPLPIPASAWQNICLDFIAGAWQNISLDFIEGLPKSEGYIVILVVVDRFTKYAHFIPLNHSYSALTVAQVIFDIVVKLYGLPQSMVSDRDKVFTSQVWKELFQLLGVNLAFSTSYHPQTDGQTERVNKCLEMYLRCSVGDSPAKWKTWLAQPNSGTILLIIYLWSVLLFEPYMVMNRMWVFLHPSPRIHLWS